MKINTGKLKKVQSSLVAKQTDAITMAVFLSSGKAGKRVRKEWSMSSDGTQVLFFVGDSKPYHMDLKPMLRKVLEAEGVR